MKALGVDWVPLAVPLQRRMQTAAVMFYCSIFFVLPFCSFLAVIVCLFTPFFFVSILYVLWIYFDACIRHTSSKGGNRWNWFRAHTFWTYFRDYFPVTLEKTCELNPDRNYIFGYHPHGVLSFGAFCNFSTEATGFSKTFPGLKSHVLTLKDNFKLPVARDVILWLGACDVSKESIQWILTKQGKGNVVTIVVGGAQESLVSKPGVYMVNLKNRKGFIKQAILSGASLVPVFSFGENDLFNQPENPPGSRLRMFQDKFKKLFHFAPIVFYGRGIFNYSFGFMPYRQPIFTVVGRPIAVKQCTEPDQDIIDKYHQLYVEGLIDLFNNNKTKYGVLKDENLTIV